jgi:hypothetical protein
MKSLTILTFGAITALALLSCSPTSSHAAWTNPGKKNEDQQNMYSHLYSNTKCSYLETFFTAIAEEEEADSNGSPLLAHSVQRRGIFGYYRSSCDDQCQGHCTTYCFKRCPQYCYMTSRMHHCFGQGCIVPDCIQNCDWGT